MADKDEEVKLKESDDKEKFNQDFNPNENDNTNFIEDGHKEEDDNELIQERKFNNAMEELKKNNPNEYEEKREKWQKVKDSIKFNKYQPNMIDFLIDNLSFSRYHFSILFTCIFSNMIDGYLFAYFQYSNKLILVKLSWVDSTLNVLQSLMLVFAAIGAMLGINAKTSDWDISSNALVAMIGFFCCIMTLVYSDTVVYISVFCLFCVCHGFISNISHNFLLELFPTKIRGLAFLLVRSCMFLGISLCGGFIWYLNLKGIEDPIFILFGFILLQTLLTITLIFIIDSPRVVFINQDSYYFVEVNYFINLL